MGWKAVPQTDPFLNIEADQAPATWASVTGATMAWLAGCLCLGVIAVCGGGAALAALAHSTSPPEVSLSSLPIDGQWRIVAGSTSASQGGCEDGSICIAYGVIVPNAGRGVSDAEATLVRRLHQRGWACTTPHPGGSVAMVSPNGHSWTEMEPVADIDVGSTDPADLMAKAARTTPSGATGLAVWINASRDRTTPAILPFHNGGCPGVAR